jgi:hypothetical protein
MALVAAECVMSPFSLCRKRWRAAPCRTMMAASCGCMLELFASSPMVVVPSTGRDAPRPKFTIECRLASPASYNSSSVDYRGNGRLLLTSVMLWMTDPTGPNRCSRSSSRASRTAFRARSASWESSNTGGQDGPKDGSGTLFSLMYESTITVFSCIKVLSWSNRLSEVIVRILKGVLLH